MKSIPTLPAILRWTFTALLVALSYSIGSVCNASVVSSGNFKTGSPTPTLGFDADLIFHITATGNFQAIIFDEWVVKDSAQTRVFSAQSLTYSLNGGANAT